MAVADRLRPQWKLLLVVTLVALVAIRVLEPNYVDLQLAEGADAFRAGITGAGRAMAAAVADMVFAAAYGLSGLVGYRAHGRGAAWERWGAAAVVAGALADEVENVFVFLNVLRRDDLTDGWVDAMQVPGTLKWLIVPGFLGLLVVLVSRAVERRR